MKIISRVVRRPTVALILPRAASLRPQVRQFSVVLPRRPVTNLTAEKTIR